LLSFMVETGSPMTTGMKAPLSTASDM
jgi:hypothetical protein